MKVSTLNQLCELKYFVVCTKDNEVVAAFKEKSDADAYVDDLGNSAMEVIPATGKRKEHAHVTH